ncbi:MAG: hypothetical protein KC912_10545 [Proteobacteria bacterium]|nr:hypothetical protein [Pseudomonadota bacterium]
MTARSAAIQGAIAHADAWLANHECDSVVSLCDRLLVRTLLPDGAGSQRDLAWLLDQRDRLLSVARHQAEAEELHLDAPALLVAVWAYPILGRPVPQLMALMEPLVRAVLLQIESVPEPQRSAFSYWARLCGYVDDFTSGPEPVDWVASVYHDTHLVFYATDYGQRQVPHAGLTVSWGRLLRAADTPAANGDMLAEILMAGLSLDGVPAEVFDRISGRLLEHQTAAGDFGAACDDFDQRHHATCAAWLALSRLNLRLERGESG